MIYVYTVLSITAVVFGWTKTRTLTNPVSIVGIFFGIPTSIASAQFSAYQIGWSYETHLVLASSLAVWIAIIPLLKKTAHEPLPPPTVLPYWLIGLWCIVFQLETILLGGKAFGVEKDIHTDVIPGLNIITRSLAVPIMICAASNIYYKFQPRKNALTLIIICISFLSRFTRIDLILGMAPVGLVMLGSMIRKKKWGYLFGMVITTLALAALFSYVQQYRWSQGGKYDVDIGKYIHYTGYSDQWNILPTMYANFCMGPENLDYTIRNSGKLIEPTYGLLSLDWLFRGLMKLHLIFPDLSNQLSYDYRHFHTGAGTVATYLEIYLYDFGVGWFWIPHLVYALITVLIYNRYSYIYPVFVGALVLTSFQSILVSSRMWISLILMVMVVKKLSVRRITPISHPETMNPTPLRNTKQIAT